MDAKRTGSFRRGLRLLHKSAAALLLLHWLSLAAAGAWVPFHEWLHGDSIPDGDDCPVAALQQGNIAAAAASSAAIVTLAGLLFLVFASFTGFLQLSDLQDVRGPPASRSPVTT